MPLLIAQRCMQTCRASMAAQDQAHTCWQVLLEQTVYRLIKPYGQEPTKYPDDDSMFQLPRSSNCVCEAPSHVHVRATKRWPTCTLCTPILRRPAPHLVQASPICTSPPAAPDGPLHHT
jgi:hypothetical protein